MVNKGIFMAEILREERLACITDWPDEPMEDGKCLHCHGAERRAFSWFCSTECEDIYVGQKLEVLA